MSEQVFEFRITAEEVIRQAGWKVSRQSGGRTELKRCPVCDGGAHHDERTFFVNTRQGDRYYGAWKCLRDGCRRSGNLWQLIELAGLDPKEYAEMVEETKMSRHGRSQGAQPVRKMRGWLQDKAASVEQMIEREDIRSEAREYRLPDKATSPLRPLSSQGREYLHRRGVDDATIELYRVCSDPQGNIAFPALEQQGGDLVRQMTKYRLARDVAKGERRSDGSAVVKTWKDRPIDDQQVGRPVLIGTHLISDEHQTLYVLEGEIKAMVAHRAVGHNCCSVPTGAAAHDWVELQWELLKQFDDIVICADNDDAGRSMVAELVRRLPDRNAIRIARIPEPHNDLTDLHDAEGLAAVRQCLELADPIPPAGIVQMSKFKDPVVRADVARGSVATSLAELDRELGALLPGTTTIVGGFTGHGKTRIAENFTVAAMARGIKVLYASFEDTYKDLRDSMERVMAGPLYVGEERDEVSGRVLHWAREDCKPFIRRWYDDLFYGLADCQPDVEQLFDLMEVAVKRHGVRFIVIDNMMAIRTPKGTQWDHLAAQAEVARGAAAFAKHYNVHVLLLVHNNQKSDMANVNTKPTIDSFAGSGEIVRWADNALQLWRYPQQYRDQAQKALDKGAAEAQAILDADAMLSVVKARGGARWIDVLVKFDAPSQRFAPLSDAGSMSKEWGWEGLLPDGKYRGATRRTAPASAPHEASSERVLTPPSAPEMPADDDPDFWDKVPAVPAHDRRPLAEGEVIF